MPDGLAEIVGVKGSAIDTVLGGTVLSGTGLSGTGGEPAVAQVNPASVVDARAHPDVNESFFTEYERHKPSGRDRRRRGAALRRAMSNFAPGGDLHIPIGRMLRYAVGAALIILGGAFTFDRFFALHTSDAVLSAAPIVLRAQIDGVLSVNPMLLGGVVDAQSPIGAITDDRVDDTKVTELQGAARIAEEQLSALHLRLGQLAAMAQETRGHVASFRNARTEQLAARLREADASVGTAEARLREAAAAFRRTEALFSTYTASAAALDLARANFAAAQSDLAAATQRQSATKAELAAAGSGVFALDAATDRSVSQQRYDQLQTRAGDLSAELATSQARVDDLHAQLAVAQARLAQRRHVELALPVRARVIRFAAQDGELVTRGQEIATAVDCSQPLVTADVSEGTFRKLFVGMQGEFRVAGDSTRHVGRIVQMVSPLDDVPGQRSGDPTRHRIVLRLDAGGIVSSCQVGRMGQVSF